MFYINIFQAKEFSDFIYERIKNVSLRTIDALAAKAMYLMSVIYEKKGELSTLRPKIFDAYKSSCLKHDSTGQATTMNIILRSYLQQNLYE